ncbi:MAG TPA: MmgE/PrpD family protein [Burkholderiales bacterium]|jgi:2-methylcitrate dehydratase PrpD|nr:MmgE/PrpD family protein [Burkholderiales bacterium]
MGQDTAAVTLARFAAGLTLAAVPAPVVARARNCIIDTVGVAAFGSRFPWSQAVARYAGRFGAGGPCTVLGMPQLRLQAPMAALVNGAFAHAFEQDSLRKPGAGVHPGAVLLPAALAAAEQAGASGEKLLQAFIAGCEVMFRIGAASKHSSEALGFHAPGLTGPYGAAIAAGVVMGLSAEQLAHALGIAGSLSSGLLAFTKSAGGGEVKRLHLGRAAEAGVLAAGLAAEGFGGPETILEGRYGFLEAYCRDADASKLTVDLGERWEVERICIKAYPCHVTAHTPVESLRTLMAEHGFAGDEVESIALSVSGKVLSHHDIRAPADLMQAQYSVPFCVALALYRDPSDPRSFNQEALADPRIATACRGILLQGYGQADGAKGAWQSRLDVQLRDGRRFSVDRETFRGAPEQPLDDAATDAKYRRLTTDLAAGTSERWLSSLRGLGGPAQLDLR